MKLKVFGQVCSALLGVPASHIREKDPVLLILLICWCIIRDGAGDGLSAWVPDAHVEGVFEMLGS